MKNIPLKSIVLALFLSISISFFSCQKNDLQNLDEVIHVRHKGADMAAYIHGNASEKVFLILLHGGPGGSSLEYRAGVMKSTIEKECAVVYFDQRGSGMSQGFYTEKDLNVEIMAEDVMALTKVLKARYGDDSRLFLLGHSWGGTLGTATLLKNDNQKTFKGWIEVDGGHDLKKLYFDNIKYMRKVAQEQIDLKNSVEYWTNILERLKSVDTVKYNQEDGHFLNSEGFAAESKLQNDSIINSIEIGDLVGSLKQAFLVNNPLTVWWNGLLTNLFLANQGIWKDISYTDQLHTIEIPSLFLWGKYDLVVAPTSGQEAYEKIGSKDKEFILFEKSGHSPMVNEPKKFGDEVIRFIKMHK